MFNELWSKKEEKSLVHMPFRALFLYYLKNHSIDLYEKMRKEQQEELDKKNAKQRIMSKLNMPLDSDRSHQRLK